MLPVGGSLVDEDTHRRRKQQKEQLDSFLQGLETTLLVQSENGLPRFEKAAHAYDEALSHLNKAQRELEKDLAEIDIVEADKQARESQMAFDRAVRCAPWWWRWTYIRGYTYFAFYVAVSGAIIFFSLWTRTRSSELLYVPMWAILLGALGAVLHGLWWLRFHTARQTIRAGWHVWVLLAPLSGAVLGILAYMLYRAGVFALGIDLPRQEGLPMVFSLIAGYSREWVNETLSKVFRVPRLAK